MYKFFDIKYNEVSLIKELWEKNRQYHEDTSEYFGKFYHSINFDDRIKVMAGFNEDTLKITVAKENDEYVGYCISTIVEGKGELESIHVSASKIGKGIGKELAIKHINWMKEKNCKVIGVTVLQENENAIHFYKSIGFYSNTLYMQQL